MDDNAPRARRRAWRASEALNRAASLKHHWAGEEHVLLALLEGGSDCPAARALAAAGVTSAGITTALAARLERFGPPVPRKYEGTLSHESFHSVKGRAEGFALGLGRATPDAEHALLALLWQVDGTADRLLVDVGTSRHAVAARLVDGGAVVPMAPPDAPVDNVLRAAAGRQSALLDETFVGPDHLVLALLEGVPDDVAERALRDCGVSFHVWKVYVQEQRRNRSQTTRPSTALNAAQPSPVMYELLGRAEGLAAAEREAAPGSRHALLAFIWSERGDAILSTVGKGTSASAVLAALQSLGVAVPQVEPPQAEPFQPHGPNVYFPLDRLEEVLAQLNKEVSGSGSYGWNHDGQRAWVSAPPGLDLQAIVDRALHERPDRLQLLLELATSLAKDLHHTWVGPDHLLLAMLHPDCPGGAPAVLRPFGLTLDDVTNAYVASMGDPHEPRDRGLVIPPATDHLLFRASTLARDLSSGEPDSEHVLLALTERWDGNRLAHMLGERGLTADDVRSRAVAMIEGVDPDTIPPPAELGPWPPPAVPTHLDLALSPAGHHPFRRRDWGSVIFQDAEYKTFHHGSYIRQYFIDRDGYAILTTDGRPIHMLVDEAGDSVLDENGKPQIGPVEVPPGCEVRHRPR